MKKGLMIALLILIVIMTGCSNKNEKLRIGLIKPSIDHLPLSFAVEKKLLNPDQFEIIWFTSGWETQEAITSKKIDCAILPFTYIWTAQSKGFPVQAISFFERETDGIVVNKDINNFNDLNNKKIGVLRASTIDVFLKQFSEKNQITIEPVYFRSPPEMISALKSNEVSGIVAYVPVIQKLGDEAKVLHWFSEDYPQHPCCNVALVEGLSKTKQKNAHQLLSILDTVTRKINTDPEIFNFLKSFYQLDDAQAKEALAHTVFKMGLDDESILFESNTMEVFKQMGYLDQIPAKEKVFNKDFL